MDPHSQAIYVTDRGELLPINKILPTENIQERGDDWFKQNDVYKRHMALAHLPNDVSVADLRALVYASGVESYNTTVVGQPDGSDTTQSSTAAAQNSIVSQLLEESEILKRARREIVKRLADSTTEKVDEDTVRASALLLIEAESKEQIEGYTDDIEQKASQIGAEVTSVQERAEVGIRAMHPLSDLTGELGEKYWITVDAAIFAAMQFPSPPNALLEEICDDEKDSIYLFSGRLPSRR